MSTYISKEPPIPKKATYELESNGQLDQNSEKLESKKSLIRDVFMGIAMKPEGARNLAKWLEEQADKLERKLGDESDE